MTANPETLAALLALQAARAADHPFQTIEAATFQPHAGDYCQHGGSRCVCDDMADRCFGGA